MEPVVPVGAPRALQAARVRLSVPQEGMKKARPTTFDLGPQVKADRFQEVLATTTSRRIGRHRVFLPDDGKPPFIVSKRVDGRPKRRNGELRLCTECDREYFWMGGARPEQLTCSSRCGGKAGRKVRHARSLAKGGPKKDALDRWFSLLVRSEGSCRHCGSTEMLQCAHIMSRRYLSVRFSLDNAMCLCARCHMKFTHRPLEWEVYVVSLMGEDAYLALKHRALAGVGSLDRVAIANDLYSLARERGVSFANTPGWSGWTSLTESKESE